MCLHLLTANGDRTNAKLLSCEPDIDSDCGELEFGNDGMIAIDCTATENELPTIYIRGQSFTTSITMASASRKALKK